MIWVGPNTIISVLMRDRQREIPHADRREVSVKMEAEMGLMSTRNVEPQKLQEARNRLCPRASGGSIALLAAWF